LCIEVIRRITFLAIEEVTLEFTCTGLAQDALVNEVFITKAGLINRKIRQQV
jgi:hypothetical protein